LAEGDKIIIHKGSGSEFTNPGDNQKYRSITESEIIVVYGSK
jgi:co-chaperonin GroES (HSP10)